MQQGGHRPPTGRIHGDLHQAARQLGIQKGLGVHFAGKSTLANLRVWTERRATVGIPMELTFEGYASGVGLDDFNVIVSSGTVPIITNVIANDNVVT